MVVKKKSPNVTSKENPRLIKSALLYENVHLSLPSSKQDWLYNAKTHVKLLYANRTLLVPRKTHLVRSDPKTGIKEKTR
jgi:hypothetical protein